MKAFGARDSAHCHDSALRVPSRNGDPQQLAIIQINPLWIIPSGGGPIQLR
jgi:hypothetical protein